MRNTCVLHWYYSNGEGPQQEEEITMMNLMMKLNFTDYAADTRRAIDTMRAQEIAVADYHDKYQATLEGFEDNAGRVKMYADLHQQASELWFERMIEASALIERDEAAVLV